MIEAVLVNLADYPTYAGTTHGFLLGLVCFFLGFLFISTMGAFWPAVEEVRLVALALAILLYLVRLIAFELGGPNWLIAFESMSWMLAIFGFGSRFLNKPSRNLS